VAGQVLAPPTHYRWLDRQEIIFQSIGRLAETNKMKEAEIYTQNQNCLLEDMDGELLLYNPASAVTLHLNGPSAIVWQLCDGERSTAEIVQLVQEAYPDQDAQIKQDVANVIDDLLERKVLESVG